MIKKKHIIISVLLFTVGLSSIRAQDTVEYTVKNGETAWGIAQKHSMKLEQFKKLNDFDEKKTNSLGVGQKVKVLSNDQQSTIESTKEPSKKTIEEPNESDEKNNVSINPLTQGQTVSKNDGRKRVCNDGKSDDKNDPKPLILVIGLFILSAASVWRIRYWNRFKVKRKEFIFVIMIMFGILIALLSWNFIRVLFKGLIIIAICVVVCFFLIKRIGSKKKPTVTSSSTDDVESLKRRINDLEREIEHLKAQNKQLAQKNDSLSKENSNLFEENIELGERIENQKFISRNPPQDSEASSKVERRDKKHLVNDTTIGSQRLYAEAIMDSVLMKVRDKIGDDTLFELELQNKNVASLNILPSVYQRILANIAYIDGCEKQITGNTTVKVTPGKAICNDQGKWIVSEKPIVFIS